MVLKNRMNLETFGLGCVFCCRLSIWALHLWASISTHENKDSNCFSVTQVVESGWEGEVLWLEYGLYPPRLLLGFSPQLGSVGRRDLVGLPGWQVELSQMALRLSLMPSHSPQDWLHHQWLVIKWRDSYLTASGLGLFGLQNHESKATSFN